MQTIQQQYQSIQHELTHFKSTTTDILTKMHCSLQRLAQTPVFTPRVWISNNTQEEQQAENSLVRTLGREPINARAVLSTRSRTLFVLWQEYTFWIASNKAAKLFTARERGRNKYAYSLRKPFWELVTCMIQHGYNHNSAIDKVYNTYNNLTVIQILWYIRRDRRTGGHQELQNYSHICIV